MNAVSVKGPRPKSMHVHYSMHVTTEVLWLPWLLCSIRVACCQNVHVALYDLHIMFTLQLVA